MQAASIVEGHWAEFAASPARQRQQAANEISYAWDALIERFGGHILTGTSYMSDPSGVGDQERLVRFLAREPRTRRRTLAWLLLDLSRRTGDDWRGARVVLPAQPGDPHYVLVVVAEADGPLHDDYRRARRELLYRYCLVTKLLHGDAQDVVGLATTTHLDQPGYHTEDVLYLDLREWTAEEEAEARWLHEEEGILRERQVVMGHEYEYPPAALPIAPAMKGRDRNRPCPCGSGRKYKRCCGR